MSAPPWPEWLALEVTLGPGDCWLWRGAKTNGYGFVQRKRKRTTAHRWVWEHINGPVPRGLEIDHLCHVRACVNPDHLEPVTHQENALRAATMRRVLRPGLRHAPRSAS